MTDREVLVSAITLYAQFPNCEPASSLGFVMQKVLQEEYGADLRVRIYDAYQGIKLIAKSQTLGAIKEAMGLV